MLVRVLAFCGPCLVTAGKSLLTLSIFPWERRACHSPEGTRGSRSGTSPPAPPISPGLKPGPGAPSWAGPLRRGGWVGQASCPLLLRKGTTGGEGFVTAQWQHKGGAGGASSRGGREKVSSSHPALPVPPRCCGKMAWLLRHCWAESFLRTGKVPWRT